VTAQLHCAGCGRRFGKRSRSLLVVASFVLCADCADDTAVHRRILFSCPTNHTARGCGGVIVTAGRAREVLSPTLNPTGGTQ
jgi:hypothetical protein